MSSASAWWLGPMYRMGHTMRLSSRSILPGYIQHLWSELKCSPLMTSKSVTVPCRLCNQYPGNHGNKGRVVSPGRVSPQRQVPDQVPKPPYISSPWITSLTGHQNHEKIEVKTCEQIQKMRDSCTLAKDVLNTVGESVTVGMTTDAIDQMVHNLCLHHGAYPSPLLYKDFPKSVCTSVNNVACHGIPDDRPLEDGDIINVDVTVFYKGYHGDTSATFLIGNVDESGRHLVAVAEECRDAGIDVCGPGVSFCEIGHTIQQCAERQGFTVIPNFCGHGIGEYFHGPPDIFHFAYNDDGKRMEEGMTFTVEPIISEGGMEIVILVDKWTAVSADNSRSAQFEHTVLVTAHGVDILTK